MKKPVRRVVDEPAYVLHSYAWSESSLILEVFARNQGRVVLLAKGAKKPTSGFRPVLLPLQPLRLSWSVGDSGEVHALKGAEWAGGHVMPVGDALLAGLYLNELVMRLLARDDPHPVLFDIYAGVVRVLGGGGHGDALEPLLRAFELLLLRHLGLLPELDCETATRAPLTANALYALLPESGLGAAAGQEHAALVGSRWAALQQALEAQDTYLAVLRACAPVAGELKPQLRALLQYHCGSPMLRTRQLLMDLQTL